MRYNLGYLDKYPIETTGTCLENVPMYRVILKNPVDPIKLEEAVKKAIEVYPLFKTEVKYDKEYYLETNDKPLIILNVSEEERPRYFGVETNGYPWRVTYYGNSISFEWNHGVTDGAGAKIFFEDLIRLYFGYDPVTKLKSFLLAPGIEPFYDPNEKGKDFVEDPVGFNVKDLPRQYQKFETMCHSLECDTKELLEITKTCKTSVAPLIAVLFSKALRKHINPKAKNKKVACNITMDIRKPFNYETMHNCVNMLRYTYLDEYDDMNIATVANIYKKKLDNNRLLPNVVKAVSDRVGICKAYHMIPIRKFWHFAVNVYGLIGRNSDCNFVFTYIGKVNLPEEVMEKIENIDFRLVPDVGQCCISAVDFNGRFNLRVHTDLFDYGVQQSFIEISKSIGLHWEDQGIKKFKQSLFHWEKKKK